MIFILPEGFFGSLSSTGFDWFKWRVFLVLGAQLSISVGLLDISRFFALKSTFLTGDYSFVFDG